MTYLSKFWLNRQVYEYYAANIGARLAMSNPVLIYQMGRVGSSSIRDALFKYMANKKDLVLMSHEFFPLREKDPALIEVDEKYRPEIRKEIENAKRWFKAFPVSKKINWKMREKFYSEMIFKNIIKKKKKAKIITIVREPIGNNVSMFFQTVKRYVELKDGLINTTMDRLADIFIEQYPHSRPIVWLDVELKSTLGIDIYQSPFDRQSGYGTITSGELEILVLKNELSDSRKAEVIKGFMGIDDFQLMRNNKTADTPRARQYREFKEAIRLPKSYIETMYGSTYAKHFYGESELELFHRKWGG